MADIPRFDLLDAAIDAILAGAPVPALADPDLAALAETAAGLAGLPRDGFRLALRAQLERMSAVTTATPYLIAANAAAAIDFYQRAFGAAELFRYTQDDGRVGHAEIQIGRSRLMLADEFPERGIHGPLHYGGTPVSLMLYVDDVDAVFAQALACGAAVERPLADQSYGDRNGGLIDPFGHRWFVAGPIRREPSSVTPYLQVEGAARLIEFLQQAFDAEESLRVPAPDGSIMHASVSIAGSVVELADAAGQYQPTAAAFHLYVPDVDAVYRRALDAGASTIQPPADHEYGERGASVRDPFGDYWYIATHNGPTFIPEGLRNLNLYLHPRRSADLIGFLQQAFGAVEEFRAQSPDGVVHHARVRVAGSVIEMGDAHGAYQPMRAAIHLHVPDCDAVFARALEAGATESFPLKDAPYGERVGGVTDPFGNIWYIATLARPA